jgi:hypothetical protein
MKVTKDNITTTSLLRVAITDREKAAAKRLAKSKGMTFQGWMGQLIKRELEEAHRGNTQFV